MRKFLLSFFILSLLLLPLTSAFAQGDPAVMGAEWLKGEQTEEGSFADDMVMTALAATALAVVGEPNAEALAWIEANYEANAETLTTDELGLILIAVAASAGDPTTFADGAVLEQFGTQVRALRGEDVGELCGALIAFPNLGQAIPPTAVQGLLALQAEDGSFTDTEGVADLTITATCTEALVAAGETEAVAKALAYLESVQNEDGGWAYLEEGISDAFGTSYVMMALNAAGEDFADWGSPDMVMYGFMDAETGAFNVANSGTFADNPIYQYLATPLAILNFRGKSFSTIVEQTEGTTPAGTAEPGATEEVSAATGDAPALNSEWPPIGAQFDMAELDSADDFLVTVIDPFTQEELTGIEIINWLAEYQYTGYMIEEHLTADVLLWLGEQDPTTWENISDATLEKLPAEVLAELPADVQARIQ